MQPYLIYPPQNSDRFDCDTSMGFVGTIWLWLKLYVSSLGFSVADIGLAESYKDRPSLLPPEAQSASCPQYRLNRGLKRRLGKPIAVVSQLHFYRHLNDEVLSPTQYLERLCRLSPLGRIRVYHLGIRRKILTWRAFAQSHMQRNPFRRFRLLLCAAPLSPD